MTAPRWSTSPPTRCSTTSIFGCLLVFLIQWIFLGDLRSAIIVGVNIPFALFFSIIILVLHGEDANLLSIGAVDFGIIVDSAVILVENIFRNFQMRRRATGSSCSQQLAEGHWGADPTSAPRPARPRLDQPAAPDLHQRAAGGQGDPVLRRHHGRGFRAAVHHAGRRGPDLRPDGAHLRLCAGGRPDRDLHDHARCWPRFLLPEQVKEVETIVVRGAAPALYAGAALGAGPSRDHGRRSAWSFCVVTGLLAPRLGSEFLPALEEGNFWIRASMPPTMSLGSRRRRRPARCARSCCAIPEVITVVSQHGRPDNGSDASPFSNVELFVPLKPFDEWPQGLTKEKLIERAPGGIRRANCPASVFNFSQYIQDNVEEAISGVKGANSVKIIGPEPRTCWSSSPTQVQRRDGAGEGRHRSRHLPRPRPAEPEHQGRPRQGRALRPEHRRRQHRHPGRPGRRRGDHGAGRRPPVQPDRSATRRSTATASTRSATSRSAIPDAGGANAYIPLARTRRPSRSIPAPPTSITRATQRFIPIKFSVRGRDLGGTVAEAQERIAKNVKLPTGYRIVWAGEFEDLQTRQGAPGDRRADQPGADPGAALQPVQFAARQPAGAGRHPVRDRRRHPRALRLRPGFQHLGGDRLHLAVRRLGDERHPDHHLLQRGQRCAAWTPMEAMFHAADTADAADADDRAVGLHRPVAGGDVALASAARCSGRWRPWWWAAC